MRRALLTASQGAFVDSNPVVVGAKGDLSTLVQAGNYGALNGHFYFPKAQPSQTVTSSITGTLTSITVALPASVTSNVASVYAVTGSISGGTFTVTAVQLITIPYSLSAVNVMVPCSLAINSGDYLALHQLSGASPVGYAAFHDYTSGAAAGFGNENGAIPNPLVPGSAVPVTAGGSGNGNPVLVQGRGA